MNLEEIKASSEYLKNKGVVAPEIGIILGTGLGNLATKIEVELTVPYEEIPHFPLSTVESHTGQLIYGKIEGKQVLAMQGRFHYYEGYNMEQIAFPVRVMSQLGIQKLMISNAAGAINLNFKKGSLMMITDHINLFPSNPLIGPNEEALGTRFPDMSEPYSNELCDILKSTAATHNIDLKEGVYISAQGPMLETPAEYRMLKILGADAVGMSTIPEVIAANHLGLPCCAVSVLTDECDPDNLAPVDIAEILEVAGKAEVVLTQLFTGAIAKM